MRALRDACVDDDFVASVQPKVGTQVQDVGPATVVQVGKAIVLFMMRTDAQAEGTALRGVPQARVPDARLACRELETGAGLAAGVVGDDVDDAEEGIRAVGSRVGAADHLDAFDVARQRALGAGGEGRGERCASVDQELHLHRGVHAEAVVGHPLQVAALLADLEARDQPKHARELAIAGGCDQVGVDDGDRARAVLQRLGEARGAQHDRQGLEEGFFGRCSGSAGGQQRQHCECDTVGVSGHRKRSGALDREVYRVVFEARSKGKTG